MHYHVKGAFCVALFFSSILWWWVDDSWPDGIVKTPTLEKFIFSKQAFDSKKLPVLTFELTFLYVLYLNGIIRSLTYLANLERENGATPRSRWLYIFSGIASIVSGLSSSAPLLISPESAGAIKSG